MNLKTYIQQIPDAAKLAVLIVVASKILVFAVGYAATFINLGPAPPLAVLQNLFNRWDAPNYVDIAKNGYLNSGNQANFIVFFPFYPLLIKAFTFDFNYANLTALAISNVSSLIAFLYLYKLAKHEFSEGVAVKAVLFLSIFSNSILSFGSIHGGAVLRVGYRRLLLRAAWQVVPHRHTGLFRVFNKAHRARAFARLAG